jgi:hypothetical protein
MRVLMVLIALVTAPFLASTAQGRSAHNASSDLRDVRNTDAQPGDDQRPTPGHDKECKDKHANNGNHYGWRHGQHDDDDCGTPPPVLGGISGTVFFDQNYDGVQQTGEAGLANWYVMLSGPVNATAITDAAGNYSFTGLPAGTYTVCEAQRFAWIQTAPQTASSCTSGFGYTIVVPAGGAVNALNFGNVG